MLSATLTLLASFVPGAVPQVPAPAPAAPVLAKEDGQDTPAPKPEAAPQPVPYPETMTIEKTTERDGKALLAKAVEALGKKPFDDLKGISFVRSSRFWRGERIFTTEAPRTRSYLNSRIAGRVDISTRNWIRPGKGRFDEFAVIENGRDRFCLKQRTQVMSTPTHEKQATAEYRIELILFLSPWLALQNGTEFDYEGHAVADTWETGKYQLPPAGYKYPAEPTDTAETYGWTQYEQVKRDYEVVTVKMPAEWKPACGESISFDLVDADTEPKIARIRFESPETRPEHVGREAIYWIRSWQNVGDLKLFKEVDVTWEGCALRSERQEFRDVALAPGLAEKDLERP